MGSGSEDPTVPVQRSSPWRTRVGCTPSKELTRRRWCTTMMVAGALLLIPTRVTLLGTAVIGISPAFILGVVLLAVGAMLRSRVGAGPQMILRLDRIAPTTRKGAHRLAGFRNHPEGEPRRSSLRRVQRRVSGTTACTPCTTTYDGAAPGRRSELAHDRTRCVCACRRGGRANKPPPRTWIVSGATTNGGG
jgi:hypothetical protein